ncbi:hypothetical protein PIB30_019112 [Stylosanthes scabra]|uniref:Uncharacterized protein n=1 Tax=Stylosanthes scabra TaxID=79078 RepID=A0ABU6V7G8_9FABA|nr:hypothetical protein [Stylosanthes scabra]
MGVKNYSMRRAAEYKLLGSNSAKEVRKFTRTHACLAPRMSTDHVQFDNTVIAGYTLHIIKKNLVV